MNDKVLAGHTSLATSGSTAVWCEDCDYRFESKKEAWDKKWKTNYCPCCRTGNALLTTVKPEIERSGKTQVMFGDPPR